MAKDTKPQDGAAEAEATKVNPLESAQDAARAKKAAQAKKAEAAAKPQGDYIVGNRAVCTGHVTYGVVGPGLEIKPEWLKGGHE